MVGAPFEDTIAAMQLITAGHLQRYPAREDHLLASRRCVADDHAARRRPRRVGSTRYARKAQPRRSAHVVRHRQPLPCPGIALRHRLIRRRPHTARHRFPYEDGDTFVRAVEYVKRREPGCAGAPTQAQAILEANAMALFGLIEATGQRRPHAVKQRCHTGVVQVRADFKQQHVISGTPCTRTRPVSIVSAWTAEIFTSPSVSSASTRRLGKASATCQLPPGERSAATGQDDSLHSIAGIQ